MTRSRVIDRPARRTGGLSRWPGSSPRRSRGPLPCPHPISTRISAIRTRSRQRTATATLTRSGSTAPDSWRAGVVERSSPRAVTVTYRPPDTRGTGVDTLTATYLLPREEENPCSTTGEAERARLLPLADAPRQRDAARPSQRAVRAAAARVHPARRPGPGSGRQVAGQFPEGHRGGRGHVEGVHAPPHRDPTRRRPRHRRRGQTGTLGPEQQRRPAPPLRWQSGIGTASGAGVSASSVNPAARTVASAAGQGSSLAYGTANTSPMLTRTLRR